MLPEIIRKKKCIERLCLLLLSYFADSLFVLLNKNRVSNTSGHLI